ISYYANDFKYNGMDKSGFKAHKNRLNKNYRFIKVTLEDVNLYGFKDYYVVVFNQLYISDINHFYSKKIQYWRNSGDAGKISAETTVKLPSINKFEFSKGNYISIAQFRRNHLKTLKVGTVSISPDGVVLSNISIRDGQEIKLVLKRSGSKTHLKAIPVLRLEGKGNSTYQSLPGVPMDDGVPTDYANGVRLESRQTTIALKKDKNSRMKSLTLFVVDPDKAADDKYQQIVTYFVN
ncbi:MAG: hypothetical protein GY765_07020, partial [bacterium]|nr:hypothetical protein [bacterium]